MIYFSGHYISDVYDLQGDTWYSCDDSHVTKLSEQKGLLPPRERDGYVFFYVSK